MAWWSLWALWLKLFFPGVDNEDSAGNGQGKDAGQRQDAFKKVGQGTMSLGVKGETLPVTMSFRVAEASLKMTSFQGRVAVEGNVRWITISDFKSQISDSLRG